MRSLKLVPAAVLGAALALAACPAAAQEPTGPFGGNIAGGVAFTSDYVFRGISQTPDGPAVQGGLEYGRAINDAIEPFIGIWGSNVDFSDANIELDYYGGIRGTIFNGLAYRLDFTYFDYPGSDAEPDLAYYEFGAALSYEFPYFVPTVGVRYSPDFAVESDTAVYYYADLVVPLGFVPGEHGLKLVGHVGRQTIDDNAAFGSPDYTEYSIGVGASAYGLDFLLQFVDTSLDRNECVGLECEERIVFTLSKSF